MSNIKSRMFFYSPVIFSCLLGILTFFLVYQLNKNSQEITRYYTPVILATSSVTSAAMALEASLTSHSYSDIESGHIRALKTFSQSYKHFKTVVLDGSFTHRHDRLMQSKNIFLEGDTILPLFKAQEYEKAKSSLKVFIKKNQLHLRVHQDEFNETQERMQFISLLAACACIFLLFSVVFVAFGLQRTVKVMERERETTAAMTALVNALEAKDAYTKGHSMRVARMAVQISEWLQLPVFERKRLYLTGLLHDIGKIGIPDQILLKEGQLTEDEFSLIKTHPTLGVEILRDSNCLEDIIPGIYYHHEKYDGTGYPEGLSGGGIPIAAQCISISDAFDAMTSSRPYRSAKSVEVALKEIERCRGAHWSDEIVTAFFKVINTELV